MIVCVAEDRSDCADAVKLLVLSLMEHCSGVRVELFCPFADDDFARWIAKWPNTHLHVDRLPGAYSWNTKPQALLQILKTHDEPVVWLDSDIIVMRDFRQTIDRLPADTIIAAEEARGASYDDSDAWRARDWGFEVGRVLPHALNSCIVRVTRAHIPLLVRWYELLQSDTYKAAQKLDGAVRPWHLLTDQDVLTALLCSKDFSNIPVEIVPRGKAIVQYYDLFGYSVRERIVHMLSGPPLFVHSQGPKPWHVYPKKRGLRYSLSGLALALSPYSVEAGRYKNEIDRAWMYPTGRMARILRAIGFGYAPLVGLPVAVVFDIWRFIRPLRRYANSIIRNAPRRRALSD